ncbi:hypothetical protein F2Q69_00034347 [Brassica cretica]|uniref:Uncharacterized protein n=1 Tax=Brassica cretica TaxID=69181 RepID=A0A8S9SCJ5_BRACR|nr:hypothetical protein F2Q69_00034347 [Brassica cretica]
MFGSIVIQKEVENDHWVSRGAGATYWSERGQVAGATLWSDVAYPLWAQHPVDNFREPELPRRSEVGTLRAKYMKCEGSQSDVPERGGEPAVKLKRPTGAGHEPARKIYIWSIFHVLLDLLRLVFEALNLKLGLILFSI